MVFYFCAFCLLFYSWIRMHIEKAADPDPHLCFIFLIAISLPYRQPSTGIIFRIPGCSAAQQHTHTKGADDSSSSAAGRCPPRATQSGWSTASGACRSTAHGACARGAWPAGEHSQL